MYLHHYALAHDVGHMILSAVIHGLIYGLIFKVFHHLGMAVAALITVLGIGAIWFWARNREGRS